MNQMLIDSVRRLVGTNNPRAVDHFNSEYPKWYVEEMLRLGEKYRNIRWLPLDLPKIELPNYDEFLDLFDRKNVDVKRVRPCAAEPWSKEDHPLGENSNYHKAQFKGLCFYSREPEKFYDDNYGEIATWTRTYCPDPMFDKIVQQVHDTWPFAIVNNLYIWESVKEVFPHRDHTMFWNLPTEFRAMLHDENEKPTLYVADVEHGDAHYIDLPEDTNVFCWSNGSQLHGSDFFGKRKQLMVITGFLSVKKTEALIDRSIAKYKDKLNYKLEI
jgi:hypothetical protein